MHLLLPLHIQSRGNLLRMSLIQILQKHLPIPLPPLIPRHIIAPAPDRARQSPGHIRLITYFCNRFEVGADSEDDAAGAGEST
jgi:hypothetical protein